MCGNPVNVFVPCTNVPYQQRFSVPGSNNAVGLNFVNTAMTDVASPSVRCGSVLSFCCFLFAII